MTYLNTIISSKILILLIELLFLISCFYKIIFTFVQNIGNIIWQYDFRIIGIGILIWMNTKAGKKWLANL